MSFHVLLFSWNSMSKETYLQEDYVGVLWPITIGLFWHIRWSLVSISFHAIICRKSPTHIESMLFFCDYVHRALLTSHFVFRVDFFSYIGLFWHSIAVHRLRNGVLGARIYIYIFLWVSCVCLFLMYTDLFWHIIAVHRVRDSGLGTWVHLSCRYDKRVAYSRRHARLVWSVSPFFFKSTHLY